MNRFSLFTRLIALAVILPPLLSHSVRAQDPIDGIAAVVNGEVITFSQVRDLVGAREQSLRETHRGQELVEKIRETREEALNDLIDRQLILQEYKKAAEKRGLKLPDYVVDEHVEKIIREEFGGDRAAFQRTLQAQGYTLTRFKEIERDKIIVQAMRQQSLQNKSLLPPGRIEDYYRKHRDDFTSEAKVKLRLISLSKEGGDSPAAQRRMAQEIRARIIGGAEFEKMAELYSEDSSGAMGGDWGWIDSRTLAGELNKTAFNLEPGKVSEVIDFGDNYYLLYVEAKKHASVKALADVRGDIEQKLLQESRQAAQEKWLQSLRDKAYIKIHP